MSEGDYLPATDTLPPRGGVGKAANMVERNCTRVIAGDLATGGETVCAAPGVFHIMWEDTPGGIETGWTCDAHAGEVRELWKPLAMHRVGEDCGMPGSVFYPAENRCGYEDGLPTVEPVRTMAVASHA